MAIVYILINCDPGSEQSVIKQLEDIDAIKEAEMVYGVYDILVKAEMETTELLSAAIGERIRRINLVRSTITLVCIEGRE